jgi:hypothetical protein
VETGDQKNFPPKPGSIEPFVDSVVKTIDLASGWKYGGI